MQIQYYIALVIKDGEWRTIITWLINKLFLNTERLYEHCQVYGNLSESERPDSVYDG